MTLKVGQTPAPIEIRPSPHVVVEGRVVDSKGNPATDLTAADFRVREDGVAREVLKAGPATEPLTVALLVDDSQAAGPALQMIREALDSFITALSGKAEIALVTFGERPTVAVDYTTDQKKLLDGGTVAALQHDQGGLGECLH